MTLAYASKSLVVTCETEWKALTEGIVGDHWKVTSLTGAIANPHHITIVPSMIQETNQASLIICTGMGLERSWLPRLLEKSGNTQLTEGMVGHLEISEHVSIDNPERDEMSGEESDEHNHSSGNPHIHLKPKVIGSAASVIVERLAEIDPSNK